MSQEPLSLDRYTLLSSTELKTRIGKVREKHGKKLMIPAHYYQKEEILALADTCGDSFQLSTVAAENMDAEAIIFCGVHFMAETADILVNRPEQVRKRDGRRGQVMIPDTLAGCTMADMATCHQVEACMAELEEYVDRQRIIPVTYVNSTAEIKAFCGRNGGIACTSTNAASVLRWALGQGERVLFFPDQHLGRNTGLKLGIAESEMVLWNHANPGLISQLALLNRPAPVLSTATLGGNTPEAIRKSKIILWNGFCTVHQRFTATDIERVRRQYPGVKVVVHPECDRSVVDAADAAGSTAYILKAVRESTPGTVWAIGTEWRMVERLIRDFPDRMILNLSEVPQKCLSMDRITLANLCWVIENWDQGTPVGQVQVNESIAADALICLERMLACH